MTATVAEIQELLPYMTDKERKEVDKLVSAYSWLPVPGPQMDAYNSEADVLFYGGSAGGGKTDLLLGLALNKHQKSAIFRRESVQLNGAIDRLVEILGSRDGFRGDPPIVTRPDGRQIEFGSCKDLGSERKWQGRPHDLKCVGKNTLVWMADGNKKLIQDVEVGEKVQTLEGSKVVSATHIFRKPAINLKAYSGNRKIAQQIQGRSHAILTNDGWVSHDKSDVSLPPWSSFSSGFHESHKSSELSLVTYLIAYQAILLQYWDQAHTLKLFQCLSDHLFLSGKSCGKADRAPGSDSVGWSERHQALLRQALCLYVSQELLSQYYKKCQFLFSRPFLEHDSGDVQIGSLFGDYQGDCSGGSRQYDEQSPLDEVLGLIYLPQQGDAEKPNPNGWQAGDRAETHKRGHSPWKVKEYAHPYTKELRQIEASFLPVSLSYDILPECELFDLTIEDTNHYITNEGFVNKNCFDEITHFLESQFRYLTTWNRSTKPGQRCRIVCTGNPPTDSQGDWVRTYWGPWLLPDHPNPAEPGELRWFTTIKGEDIECPNGEPFSEGGHLIYPKSRTFIPSKVQDNPFLISTDYEATLQALPEPLRSQMLHGDFTAGTDDDPWQVIPTDWVRQAQDRWEEIKPKNRGPLDSIGLDPARGGRDETVISRRYGSWFDELQCYPGSQTPDGPAVAALVIQVLRDKAPVHIDVIGIGSSVYDHLKGTGNHVIPVNSAEKTESRDRAQALRMANYRAALWWKMREDLDPKNQEEIALPPGSDLRADLCAPRWTLRSNGVLIESKQDIIDRIGRSPDKGDAVVMANIRTMKRGQKQSGIPGMTGGSWGGM